MLYLIEQSNTPSDAFSIASQSVLEVLGVDEITTPPVLHSQVPLFLQEDEPKASVANTAKIINFFI